MSQHATKHTDTEWWTGKNDGLIRQLSPNTFSPCSFSDSCFNYQRMHSSAADPLPTTLYTTEQEGHGWKFWKLWIRKKLGRDQEWQRPLLGGLGVKLRSLVAPESIFYIFWKSSNGAVSEVVIARRTITRAGIVCLLTPSWQWNALIIIFSEPSPPASVFHARSLISINCLLISNFIERHSDS